MVEQGDLWLAELRDEARRPVLVVSNQHLHRRSERVLVAPATPLTKDEQLDPWRLDFGGTVFAMDLIQTLPSARLLEAIGRVSAREVTSFRRAIRAIT